MLVQLVKDEGWHMSLNIYETTLTFRRIFSRFASAGDDGLVLVWNVEVRHCKVIISVFSETAQNTAALIAYFYC